MSELSEMTPQQLQGVVYAMEDKVEALTQQRDDLLAACQAALKEWGDYAPPQQSRAYKAMVQVRAAIARATPPPTTSGETATIGEENK